MLTEENGTKENGHEEKMDEDDEKESEVEERENEKEDKGVESEEKENEQDNDNTESDEKDVSEDDKKEIVEGEETSENDEQTGENEANEEGDEEEGDEDEGENEVHAFTRCDFVVLSKCVLIFFAEAAPLFTMRNFQNHPSCSLLSSLLCKTYLFELSVIIRGRSESF